VATDIVAQLMNEFRGDTLGRVASALGESPAKTATALGAVLPALMGGLVNKASTTAGASDLLDGIRRNKLDARSFGDTSSAIATSDGILKLMNAGRLMLESVFGARTNSVTDWVASFAGINRSSSRSMLTLALPLVIGQITCLVSGGLNASSLQTVLADQRSFLEDAPAGLASALGISEFGRATAVGPPNPSARRRRHASSAHARMSRRWAHPGGSGPCRSWRSPLSPSTSLCGGS
jgi:hypothetical protein